MTRIETLASITAILLDDETGSDLLSETIDLYRDLLLSASGIDLGAPDAIDHLNTGTGVAIGATWAALCVDDMIRTKRFVSGLYGAVREVRARRPGPVHVLYAGTGPFVTLALPLMTRFTPEELQFTCIEINNASYAAAQRLIETLGLGAYVPKFVKTDASTYVIDEPLPVDIMLSETMQYCLIDEMQVPIALNLMSQLPASVIMLPERITLRLGVMKDYESREITHQLGTILTIDRESLAAYRPTPGSSDFPTVRLQVPVPPAGTQPGPLAVRTAVDVYGGHGLTDFESGLTVPRFIGDYPTEAEPLAAIDFTYQLHPSPLLWMEFVQEEEVAPALV